MSWLHLKNQVEAPKIRMAKLDDRVKAEANLSEFSIHLLHLDPYLSFDIVLYILNSETQVQIRTWLSVLLNCFAKAVGGAEVLQTNKVELVVA